jgi:flagellar biosynthesis protein FliQ
MICGKNTHQIHEHSVTYVPFVIVMNLCTLLKLYYLAEIVLSY